MGLKSNDWHCKKRRGYREKCCGEDRGMETEKEANCDVNPWKYLDTACQGFPGAALTERKRK